MSARLLAIDWARIVRNSKDVARLEAMTDAEYDALQDFLEEKHRKDTRK